MNKASKGVCSPGEKSNCEMPRREPASYSCRDLKVSLAHRSWRISGGRDRGRKAKEEEVFKPLMHGTTVAPLTRCLLSMCLRMASHAVIALCASDPFWRGLPYRKVCSTWRKVRNYKIQMARKRETGTDRKSNCETM